MKLVSLAHALLLAAALAPAPAISEGSFSYTEQLAGLQRSHLVTIVRYPIEGSTADELRRELDGKGPLDWDGKRGDAFTHWKVEWRWRKDSEGKAHFRSPYIGMTIQVTLPHWDPPAAAPEQLLTSWDRFMQALIRHEKTHVTNALALRPLILGEIGKALDNKPELTPLEANNAVKAAIERIRQLDREFDSRTDYGRTQGVRFPEPAPL